MSYLDDEQGAPEVSEQPSGDLTVDGGKTDSETIGEASSSKQGDDTLKNPDSEVTEGVPVEGEAAPTEGPDGNEEKESSVDGDTGNNSGEVHKQQQSELSSDLEADPVIETKTNVESLTDSESKTGHDKDKLGEENGLM